MPKLPLNAAALIVGCLFLTPLPAAELASKPNVILIVIDDLGWADLGCYGSKFHKTPNLDRLAAGGIRFTQGYSACPVCSPTRAAIMTGKWPARLHLTDWIPGRGNLPEQRLSPPKFRQQLPLDEITIAEIFQKAGYATASIGKWHLGGAGFGPELQGFDLNIAGDSSGSPPGYFAPFLRPTATAKGKKAKGVGRKLAGLEEAPDGAYLTDLLTDAAISFIEQQRERPFFLYLPHYTVHTPLQAKADLIAKYPAAEEFRGHQSNPIYAAMIERLDDGIGRILARLDKLKLAEHTIVVFTSDNGGLATQNGANTPATSNAPLREGKGFLYEGGIRVPLIVRWPVAVKTGQTTDALAYSVDLLPTLAELCGVSLPHAVDGITVAATFKGEVTKEREAIYWHYPHYSPQGGRPGGAIRAGDWKLIEFYDSDRRELFNLKIDPREGKNLAAQEPQRVQQLAEQLAAWRNSVSAKSMTPNPAYAPNPQAADGTITMHARSADVYGSQLRYEPLPHKSTLGYWTSVDDWARFEFELKTPGTFVVELLVGCGRGSGGSTVQVATGETKQTFTVEETGGFQQFVPRSIGRITLEKPGRHSLDVRPQSKPGPAVMDLRQVRLIPVQQ